MQRLARWCVSLVRLARDRRADQPLLAPHSNAHNDSVAGHDLAQEHLLQSGIDTHDRRASVCLSDRSRTFVRRVAARFLAWDDLERAALPLHADCDQEVGGSKLVGFEAQSNPGRLFSPAPVLKRRAHWYRVPVFSMRWDVAFSYASGEGHGVSRFWAKRGMLAHAASAAVIFRRQFQGSSS